MNSIDIGTYLRSTNTSFLSTKQWTDKLDILKSFPPCSRMKFRVSEEEISILVTWATEDITDKNKSKLTKSLSSSGTIFLQIEAENIWLSVYENKIEKSCYLCEDMVEAMTIFLTLL
jgi:hypothetical protein